MNDVWCEPVRGDYPEPWLLSIPGRERLETFRRPGAFPPPPLFHLTGARPTEFGDGTAEAQMPASGWLLNSAGLIGGGTLAILADIAFGCSAETQLPAAVPYTTAELSLTFLRPARRDGMLSAHGQAVHVGRRVGLSEVFVRDPSSDALIAHGTSRLSIMPPLDGVPERPAEMPVHEAVDYESPDPYLRPAPLDDVLDPGIWEELPGREILERQLRGELPPPPIHRLTGIALTEVGDGRAVMRMPASEWLNSPARRLQGGTIAMLADAALLVSVVSKAPAGIVTAGLDLKVNFLRPGVADGRDLVATAEVEHSGRTLAISRAVVENADGKPVVLATGTAMYLADGAGAFAADVELSEGGARSPQ